MRDAPGVGLAAPQIGEPLQVCVIEVESQTTTGFQVGILVGTGLFGDGFESGNTSAWTDTVP